MKATTLITMFLATAVATVTAQMPRIQPFKLRATTYRGALPAFSGNIDLFQDFSVGVGRSNDPNYSGFVQYMNHDPVDGLPDGPIYRESDNAQGFLVPTETPNLFDFLIHPTIPQNALTSGFSIAPLSCGGNCGGLQLLFDEPNPNKKWIAYPMSDGKGYRIRYWNGAGEAPAGGYPVWLLKDSV